MKGQRGSEDFFQKSLSRRDFLKLGGTGLAGMTLLASCGSGGNQAGSNGGASDFPNRPITVFIGASAGGETDTGARILQPYVEEALGGASLSMVNKPGAGTWAALTEVATAEPDGYTVGFLNSPNFFAGYLDPQFNRSQSLESFALIGNQVTDFGVIAVNPKESRFTTVDELIDNAKKNRTTGTSTGIGSDEHFAMLTLNDEYGTKFEPVHFDSLPPGQAAVLGGNVDVLFANVGGATPLQEAGRVKVLAVMKTGKERSPFLPSVPTLEEAGYGNVYSWASRGVAGPKGIEPAIMDVLVSAFGKGIQNKEHKRTLEKQGLQVDYRDPDEYLEMLKRDEQNVKELGGKYLW